MFYILKLFKSSIEKIGRTFLQKLVAPEIIVDRFRIRCQSEARAVDHFLTTSSLERSQLSNYNIDHYRARKFSRLLHPLTTIYQL